jgi:hypothetical protein
VRLISRDLSQAVCVVYSRRSSVFQASVLDLLPPGGPERTHTCLPWSHAHGPGPLLTPQEAAATAAPATGALHVASSPGRSIRPPALASTAATAWRRPGRGWARASARADGNGSGADSNGGRRGTTPVETARRPRPGPAWGPAVPRRLPAGADHGAVARQRPDGSAGHTSPAPASPLPWCPTPRGVSHPRGADAGTTAPPGQSPAGAGAPSGGGAALLWRRAGWRPGPAGGRQAVRDALKPSGNQSGTPSGAPPGAPCGPTRCARARGRGPSAGATSRWRAGARAVPPPGRDRAQRGRALAARLAPCVTPRRTADSASRCRWRTGPSPRPGAAHAWRGAAAAPHHCRAVGGATAPPRAVARLPKPAARPISPRTRSATARRWPGKRVPGVSSKAP